MGAILASPSASLYAAADVDQLIRLEEIDFERAAAAKRPGERAFIARDSGRGKAVIMAGRSGDWFRAMTCYGPGFEARAAEYVTRFNAHVARW